MPAKRGGNIMIGAAIFIILELAALSILRKNSVLQDIWFTKASYRVMGGFWSGSEKIRNYFSLEKENEELALQNALLLKELETYKNRENLSSEDNYPAHFADKDFSYIPATVVKMSYNATHNFIILNKGYADGITPQSGIITTKGIVGIIQAVDKHYSYGFSLKNNDISVSSKIGKEGVLAILNWDGESSNKAIAKDIPLHYNINQGDTIRTSGYSSIFPSGIPIGISGKSSLSYGATKQIEVTLFQDLNAIHYVIVTKSLKREEISKLEEVVTTKQIR